MNRTDGLTNRNGRPSLARWALATACVLALGATAAAQTNPVTAGGMFMFRSDDGNTYSGTKSWAASGWLPALNPWNGRNTSAGNRIENGDFGGAKDFPFDVANPNVPGGVESVTAAKSDTAWDAYYTGYTRLSGSTYVQNCYGYATGKGYWVGTAGFTRIVADEYNVYSDGPCKENCILKPAGDHCILLTACCPNGTAAWNFIAQTKEKNASSGVYKRDYYCPGGGSLSGTIYCKK
jgi:hypothetical protein